MISSISLRLLDKQIMELREQLDREVGRNIYDLSSPEVLAINHQIDQLIVLHIRLTQSRALN